jgi:hypothetical protein
MHPFQPTAAQAAQLLAQIKSDRDKLDHRIRVNERSINDLDMAVKVIEKEASSTATMFPVVKVLANVLRALSMTQIAQLRQVNEDMKENFDKMDAYVRQSESLVKPAILVPPPMTGRRP